MTVYCLLRSLFADLAVSGIETRAGERLLNRTEMRMATEVADVMTFSKRVSVDEPAKQSGILQGKVSSLRTHIVVETDGIISWYGRLSLLDFAHP